MTESNNIQKPIIETELNTSDNVICTSRSNEDTVDNIIKNYFNENTFSNIIDQHNISKLEKEDDNNINHKIKNTSDDIKEEIYQKDDIIVGIDLGTTNSCV